MSQQAFAKESKMLLNQSSFLKDICEISALKEFHPQTDKPPKFCAIVSIFIKAFQFYWKWEIAGFQEIPTFAISNLIDCGREPK